jgi:hypothetical protein
VCRCEVATAAFSLASLATLTLFHHRPTVPRIRSSLASSPARVVSRNSHHRRNGRRRQQAVLQERRLSTGGRDGNLALCNCHPSQLTNHGFLQNIPANDEYWCSFWELPESAEDVFTLFSAADIRRTRDSHIENLETLLLAVTSRLFALRNHSKFPDPDVAPEKDALNCIRVLTRVLPFIYESEQLQDWENTFFWGTRRRRTQQDDGQSEVIFDESNLDTTEQARERAQYEDTPPLMEELVDVLVELLFYTGFTLPQSSSAGKAAKVTYAIWQSGVGCNTPVGTTREGENNKIEILRLLLAIASKAMFMPANILPVKGVRVLTYMTTCPDKRVVLSMLCSLLNTTLKYNPASWRVPYDHVVFTDPRQVLVTYSLQMLLVLLLYPVPEGSGPILKNNYRHYLGRLHRTQDFQFCVDGMTRILNQPVCAALRRGAEAGLTQRRFKLRRRIFRAVRKL